MGKNNRITPVMFVSKTEDVSADYYIESEAEEIYVPDTHINKNRGQMGTQFDNIVGYQKYLHIVSKLAQDNTD